MTAWRDIQEIHREEARYAMRCALLVSDDPVMVTVVNKLLSEEWLTPEAAKAWYKNIQHWREQVIARGLTLPT